MENLINSYQLQTLLRRVAELGAIQALCRTGHLRPYMNKSEAFKRYGRANIEHWIENGLITPRKDGGHSACWRIDRLEAEVLKISIELIRFL